MRLIDTHCHLNDPTAFPDVEGTVKEAVAAGVERIVVVGIDEVSSEEAVRLAEAYEEIYATVGWHPNCSARFDQRQLKRIEGWLQHPKVVALGEIGLDWHWDDATPEQQWRALEAQLELAEQTAMPVVFHCREAFDDLIPRLERSHPERFVLHCFSGDRSMFGRANAIGAWFGFDGPLTFRKNDALRQIANEAPRDRTLIETDAPYLSPHPNRGKPNKPAWVGLVNQTLAACWQCSEGETAARTTENAERFFRWP